MSAPLNVLVLVGSLRADSFNARLATLAIDALSDSSVATVYDGLGDLPHYSEDLDADAPTSVQRFRQAVADADALVVTTPEYNGTISSVLKNAIDWASRPRGEAALAGKPVAVLAVSASPRGGQWAREDAVRVLTVAGARPLATTIGIGSAWERFDAAGRVDADTERAVSALLAELTSAELHAAA